MYPFIVLIRQLTESMRMGNLVRVCTSITVPGSTETTKSSPGRYKFEQRHFYFYYPIAGGVLPVMLGDKMREPASTGGSKAILL